MNNLTKKRDVPLIWLMNRTIKSLFLFLSNCAMRSIYMVYVKVLILPSCWRFLPFVGKTTNSKWNAHWLFRLQHIGSNIWWLLFQRDLAWKVTSLSCPLFSFATSRIALATYQVSYCDFNSYYLIVSLNGVTLFNSLIYLPLLKRHISFEQIKDWIVSNSNWLMNCAIRSQTNPFQFLVSLSRKKNKAKESTINCFDYLWFCD